MEDGRGEGEPLTLVARKPCFSLPTACPTCLPAYIYLKFANVPFNLEFNLIYPDSDQIPFVESGDYVAYNNENGGVLQKLKEDGIVDLDADVSGRPEWVSYKAMVESWLADAIMYELWVGSDGKLAHKIYYSDLPWPIGKILYYKQVYVVKQQLGISSENAAIREKEIYRRATVAYGALSAKLGEQSLFFEDGPTSLDAVFLGHALFTLLALPETSILRSKLLVHTNLVKYAETLKMEYIDASSSSSSVPQSRSFSSASKRDPSYRSSRPKSKPEREKTEEDRQFRRRSQYFIAAQAVAILIILSFYSDGDDDS